MPKDVITSKVVDPACRPPFIIKLHRFLELLFLEQFEFINCAAFCLIVCPLIRKEGSWVLKTPVNARKRPNIFQFVNVDSKYWTPASWVSLRYCSDSVIVLVVLLTLNKIRSKTIIGSAFHSFQMLEIEKGANDFNIPIIRSNRKLVASTDGGLHNPSCLVFNSAWKVQQLENEPNKKLNYPSPAAGIERPKSDEDIAFMSVSAPYYSL